MIEIVVCFDDNDSNLGDYFDRSYFLLAEYFSAKHDLRLNPISGLDCSEEKLKTKIDSFDQNSLVFVGLLHGNEEQLLTDNDVLVDSKNISHFKGSFFYSPACSTANVLGGKLIENGCLSYVGCDQVTYAATDEDYFDIYANCENECLKLFLSSDESIEYCFNHMLDYFNDQIELLSVENDEVLIAMDLMANRDSFVLMGNKELRKSDLAIS